MNDLEFQGARELSRARVVLPLSRYYRRLKKEGIASPDFFQALASALAERGVRSARIPESFPAGGVGRLGERGIRTRVLPDPFLPERARKTPREVLLIRKALRAAEAGMATAILTLAASRIRRDGYLHLSGRRLTSESLRESAERAMFAAGAAPFQTIVAGGFQGSDPHEKGRGPLPAHRPIVLDFFPRDRSSGFHGDLTRTVVKGRADAGTRAAFFAVATAQRLALAMLRAGTDGSEIHRRVCEFFTRAGFANRGRGAAREGFIHGTGHGLGLDLHEFPPVSARKCRLEAGHVVTIEPGLYYRDLGGIRIEDVALVTRRGHRRLTRFPIFLEIP